MSLLKKIGCVSRVTVATTASRRTSALGFTSCCGDALWSPLQHDDDGQVARRGRLEALEQKPQHRDFPSRPSDSVLQGGIAFCCGEENVMFWNRLFRARKKSSADGLPYRVMIISVPKSGTYMYAKLLETFGLVPTSLHFSDDGTSYTDYRFA